MAKMGLVVVVSVAALHGQMPSDDDLKNIPRGQPLNRPAISKFNVDKLNQEPSRDAHGLITDILSQAKQRGGGEDDLWLANKMYGLSVELREAGDMDAAIQVADTALRYFESADRKGERERRSDTHRALIASAIAQVQRDFKGDRQAAQESFLRAKALDPHNEQAKQGLQQFEAEQAMKTAPGSTATVGGREG